jgi:hypothetical protein
MKPGGNDIEDLFLRAAYIVLAIFGLVCVGVGIGIGWLAWHS